MKWRKLGQIFCPDNHFSWMVSHAMLPLPHFLSNDTFRIFFSSRDSRNRSFTSFIDLNMDTLAFKLHNKPVLSPGRLGCFDDSGSMALSLVSAKNELFLVYAGWCLEVAVPFRFAVGIAQWVESDQEFKRIYAGPIFDRNKTEPYFVSSSFVLAEDDIYKMWYLCCTEWSQENGNPKHHYHIKYAESDNLFDWYNRSAHIAIDYKNKNEYAIARPCVIKEKGLYKMWYCYRGSSYRIGYAESLNGKDWNRKDEEAGIDVSKEGWDSEMICYPYVFDHQGKRYMFYNGNAYGKTGFGLAVLEQD